ncbi:hypothetical protein DFH08DRAFT_618472, partial [Mycena albidolilacea]
ENKVQEAVIGIQTGVYKNVRQAVEALEIPKQAATIRRRLEGNFKPRIDSQVQRQLLTPTQEEVLAEWMKFYGFAGLPLNKKTVAARVKALCRQSPGKNWMGHFLGCHPDCTPGRPSGLDPKRVTAFN